MKKIIILIIFVCMSVTSFAQKIDYSQQLENLSLEMTVSIKEYYGRNLPNLATIPARSFSDEEKRLYEIIEKSLHTNLMNENISLVSNSRRAVLIEEVKLSYSGLTDSKSALEAGKLLNIDTFAFINIFDTSGVINVSIEIVDVETGAIILSRILNFNDVEDIDSAVYLLLGNKVSVTLSFEGTWYRNNDYFLDESIIANYGIRISSESEITFGLGLEYMLSTYNSFSWKILIGATIPDISIVDIDNIYTAVGGFMWDSLLKKLDLRFDYSLLLPVSDYFSIFLKPGIILAYDWHNFVRDDDINEIIVKDDFSSGIVLLGSSINGGFKLSLSRNISFSLNLGYNVFLPTQIPLIPEIGKVFIHYPVFGFQTALSF